jgi:hypothetical protein
MNSDRATPRPLLAYSAKIRRLDPYSLRFQSATRPDNGIRQNRFLFADNFGMVPASIPFHGIG